MTDHSGLGAYLRDCREARALSVEDVSAATRIAPRMILAIEDERFSELPASVYVRGFIRAYCACVGVPPDRAFSLCPGHLLEAPAAPAPVVVIQAPAPVRSRSRRPVTIGMAVAGGLLVVLGVGAYRLTTVPGPSPRALDVQGSGGPAPGPSPSAPAPVSAAGAAGAEGESPASRPAAGMSGAVAPVEAEGGRVLVMRADDTTWVRVTPEGAQASEVVLGPGGVREWRSQGRFTVTVGNAGGVSLELDGAALPPLGGRGQVVRDVVIPPEPGS